MIKLVKNIIPGKSKFFVFFLFLFYLINNSNISAIENPENNYIEIKILDKVSSKNNVLKIKIGKEYKFKNLIIKSLKCKNSEFDDNPEITSYLQVRDLNNKDNNEVFVFNGWTFSSSPSIQVFDHPVYDLWILRCY